MLKRLWKAITVIFVVFFAWQFLLIVLAIYIVTGDNLLFKYIEWLEKY